MFTLYQHPNCNTCKKAIRWLDERGVEYEKIDLREVSPDAGTLARVQERLGVPVKKLFNTSGQSYRKGGWKDRLPNLSEDEARDALANDGMLVKRPLLVGDALAIGFREDDWAERILPQG